MASGFFSIQGLTVDGSGNVFVADLGSDALQEFVAVDGVVLPGTKPILVGSGFTSNGLLGTAVDGRGNVFVTTFVNHAAYEIDRSDPPTLTFASTPVPQTSADSPQSVLFENSGNITLAAAMPGLSIGANFEQLSGSGTPPDCTPSFSLAAGAICNLSIGFLPQSVGTISSAAVFTDNALNATNAMQTIPLNGVATGAPTITFTTALSYVYGQSVQLTASSSPGDEGAFTYSLQGNPPQPASVNTFTGAVTLLGTGYVGVQVNQAAYGDYAAGQAGAGFSITQAASSTALSGVINSGSTATLTATVSPLSQGYYPYGPSNTVSFYNSGTLLGTAPLSGTTATYTTTTLTGMQNFTAVYNGDANFSASAVSSTVRLNFPIAPTITFTTAGSYVYGQVVQLTASSPGDAGAFTYSLAAIGTIQPAIVNAVTGAVTLEGTGSVAVQVNQAAYGNYAAGQAGTGFSITRAPSLTALNGVVNSNYSATLTATVSPLNAGVYPYGPSATVSFYDNGMLLGTAPLSGTTATYTTTALTGMQNLTAVYNGDANFFASAVSTAVQLTFTVAPTINLPTASSYAYEQVFQAVASSNSSGAITYSLVSGPATVTASGTVTITGEGPVTIEASEAAAPGYNAATKTANFIAVKAASSINLAGSVVASPANTVSLTATVTPTTVGTYPQLPNSTVSFYDGGTFLATVGLNGTTATYTTSALTGTQNFTAIYNGDSNFAASMVSNTVSLAVTVAPTITFTTLQSYAYGQSFQLAAKSGNDTGAFTYSGTGPANVTAAGTVLVTGEGTVMLQANEAAAPGYNAGTASTSFTAAQATTTTALTATQVKSGATSTATLVATVAPQFTGTPTKAVSFYDGSMLLGQVSLTNGAATFNTLALTAGMHNFSAVYAGDANFIQSTSKTAQLTVALATPVQFRLLATTLIYPEPPAFAISIAVVGAKAPTGTITIYDTVNSVATKVAAYTLYAQTRGVLLGLVLPPLNVGQHSLSATYSGDANYMPGQSASIAVTVTPGPVKLTLKCASTQIKLGQTLSCSVHANEAVLPVTGTAGFTVSGGASGLIVLDRSGSGTISVAPASGSHTLTATYQAQGDYQAAAPVSVTFTVN